MCTDACDVKQIRYPESVYLVVLDAGNFILNRPSKPLFYNYYFFYHVFEG